MKNEGRKKYIKDYFTIIDKTGVEVPFNLNSIQDRYYISDITGRDIILKARQQGFSSLITADFAIDFLNKQNSYSVVVADDSDNAMGLLSRVKHYVRCWCEKQKVKEKDILKYNSKYELHNKVFNSTFSIGTAQNTQFGRSKTITNLHLSEGAFYPHLREMLAGSLQAVVPNGKVVIETTANGFNEFKEFWDESERGETGFTPHFYGASEFYDGEFLEQKKKELGRLYVQEYPDTPLEAFITSGDLYFDRDALGYYLESIRQPIQSITV